jgi:hypothetical protein
MLLYTNKQNREGTCTSHHIANMPVSPSFPVRTARPRLHPPSTGHRVLVRCTTGDRDNILPRPAPTGHRPQPGGRGPTATGLWVAALTATVGAGKTTRARTPRSFPCTAQMICGRHRHGRNGCADAWPLRGVALWPFDRVGDRAGGWGLVGSQIIGGREGSFPPGRLLRGFSFGTALPETELLLARLVTLPHQLVGRPAVGNYGRCYTLYLCSSMDLLLRCTRSFPCVCCDLFYKFLFCT